MRDFHLTEPGPFSDEQQVTVTPTDFFDLNERVGGYDHDWKFTPERSSGDPGAIRRAHAR